MENLKLIIELLIAEYGYTNWRFSTKLHLLSRWIITNYTGQKMKFSVKDFFSKRDQIRSVLQI